MNPEDEILIYIPEGVEIRNDKNQTGITAAEQLLAQPFKEGMRIKTNIGGFNLSLETQRFDAGKGGWVTITTPHAPQAFA